MKSVRFLVFVFIVAVLFQSSVNAMLGYDANCILQIAYAGEGKKSIIIFPCVSDGSALESSDSGMTWKLLRKEEIPNDISSHSDGNKYPSYHLLNGNLLLRISANGELTDITPREILDGMRRTMKDEERRRYTEKYGWLIPNDKNWFRVFIVSSAVMLTFLSYRRFRRSEKFMLSAINSFAVSFILGLSIYSLHSFISGNMLYRQWYSGADGCREYPMLFAGLFFYFIGSSWLAPVTAVFIFPLTPAGSQFIDELSSWKTRIMLALLPYCFIVCLITALCFGRSIFSGVC